MLLLREDLWTVIIKTSLKSITPTHQSTWDSKDQRTRANILLSMKDIQRVHVKIYKKTKEVWDTLKNQFQIKNVMNVNFFTMKFYILKMKEEDITKHITKFCNLLN